VLAEQFVCVKADPHDKKGVEGAFEYRSNDSVPEVVFLSHEKEVLARFELETAEDALSTMKTVLENLRKKKVERAQKALVGFEAPAVPFLGVAGTSEEGGIRITRVYPGGPVAKAKLAVGDLITAIEDTPVSSVADLFRSLSHRSVGDKVQIGFEREGRTKKKRVQLESRPPGGSDQGIL
jgi:C-terminal processing protease CtpA/Prc